MSEDVAPRERRVRRRRPGLASALLGAGLLIALGFGLGVIAGLVMEEPDLVLDFVAGRTESVPLGGAEGRHPLDLDTPPTPDVAAGSSRTPEAASAGDVPGASGETRALEPSADFEVGRQAPGADPATPGPASAAVSPEGRFAVQVGAFAEASAAEQLARRLRKRGLPVYVAPSASGDTERWRVRVGPLPSRAEAEQLAARLERDERLSTWVLAESPL